MLTNPWILKIRHDFLNEDINLTNIISDEWIDSEEYYTTKTTYFPATFAKWIGLKPPKIKIKQIQKKTYRAVLEINGVTSFTIEVPDDILSQVIATHHKGLFFHSIKEKLVFPEAEDMIEILWQYICDELKKILPQIEQESEKSLREIRKEMSTKE